MVTFCVLAALSIGIFVLPVALALTFWVARSSRARADAIGLLVGVGAMLVLIWAINRDYTPCPSEGFSLSPTAPSGSSVSCGGFDARPWLAVGLIVIAVGLSAYAVVRSSRGVSA